MASTPTSSRQLAVEVAVLDPPLWMRLVAEQAERMKGDPKVDCHNPMFGQYQHPDMAGMFGCSGEDEFHVARDKWLADVRHRIFLSPLEQLAECAEATHTS